MIYTLIKADTLLRDTMHRPTVFLGGSCKGRDWRVDMLRRFEKMDVTFINPRRDHFADPEIDPGEHARQVLWERQAIDKSDIVLFWLGEGLPNQASRVEIGYALGKGKEVVIGADETFLGCEHLTAFSGLILSSSLDGLMNRFSALMHQHIAKHSA